MVGTGAACNHAVKQCSAQWSIWRIFSGNQCAETSITPTHPFPPAHPPLEDMVIRGKDFNGIFSSQNMSQSSSFPFREGWSLFGSNAAQLGSLRINVLLAPPNIASELGSTLPAKVCPHKNPTWFRSLSNLPPAWGRFFVSWRRAHLEKLQFAGSDYVANCSVKESTAAGFLTA